MRDEQHYHNMLEANPNANIGFSLAARMIYAARWGVCENENVGDTKWHNIVAALRMKYGNEKSEFGHSEVELELELAKKSLAASTLGSIKSARKAKSSAVNGKLGGRPRKSASSI